MFRKLVLGDALLAFAVVPFGAYVRLSDAGLLRLCRRTSKRGNTRPCTAITWAHRHGASIVFCYFILLAIAVLRTQG